MRPKSHRDQEHMTRCGNCKFAHLVAYKLDLLCFRGDDIQITGKCEYDGGEHIDFNGDDVAFMEGDQYDKVWGGRVVDPTDVCDEWDDGSDDSASGDS